MVEAANNAKNIPVYAFARAYVRNQGVSPAQAYLKHSLVPLRLLAENLPETGTILDLGCGEGILSNLVARALPQATIIGIDRDAERIAIAQRNAAPNARFETGDFFTYDTGAPVDAIIFNDVVHHYPFARHAEILRLALLRLRPGGILILKEVDRLDKADLAVTRFFDSRLYPHDTLSFRTAADWRDLLARLGVTDVATHHVFHPWPASRTIFVMHRPENAALRDPAALAEQIGRDNQAASSAGKTVIFMTGGTGFIGTHLARHLLEHGRGGKPVRLLLLTRNPSRLPEEFRRPDVTALPGDLSDLPALKSALAHVDYVFHLAAEVKLTQGTDLWRNNHQGTVDLVTALQGNTTLRRFMHASTMGAVDRAPNDPCTVPLDETVTPHPLSEYGRTKLEAERAIIGSGLPYTIVRVPWGYGAGMTPDTHVRFLLQGVANDKPFSWFNFPGKVSIAPVQDLVQAFILTATSPTAANETYFVSDGRPLALGDLFRRGGSLLTHSSGFIGIPQPLASLARALRRFMPLQLQNLNSDVLCVSNAKIRALGFQPSVPQRQALAWLAEDIGARPAEPRRLISLVTGSASGIGLALARRLHAEGHALLLIDRNEHALQTIAAELNARYLPLDLADATASDAIDHYLEQHQLRLDWVINNAGLGARGETDAIDARRQELLIDVNCRAVASLSRLAVRHFRSAGHGTLINIGSTAGFQPLPYMAAYAASKAFVQNFTRSLAGECLDQPGIHIMTANPTGTATNFQTASGVKQNPRETLVTPDAVAERIVNAAYARQLEFTDGLRGHAMALLSRLLPLTVQIRLWRKLMKKMR
jgi:short-subunit dehydrogenase/SAM-dependent methyltransferase